MTRYSRRKVVIAIGVSACALMLAVPWFERSDLSKDPRPDPTSTVSASRTSSFAVETQVREPAEESGSSSVVRVLRRWDRQRALAYAHGDVDALAALYVPESQAGATDVALLRSYTRRGLRVDGLTMQFLAVDVVSRKWGRLRLRVSDRVHGGVAVGASTRVPLPRDEVSMRLVTLRREASSVWKVSTVSNASEIGTGRVSSVGERRG